MKILIFTILCSGLICTSCDPKMAGPIGNIFNQESYWELEAYLIREYPQSLELAGEMRFLSFPDSLGTDYYESFDFWDKDKNKTTSWKPVQNVSFDVDRHLRFGTYIKRTDHRKYFKVTVTVDNSTGENLRLELSNLMEGGYKIENDTVRYIYLPTEKF